MKRTWQLVVILCAAVAISSTASHIAVRWLRIKATATGYRIFGHRDHRPFAVLFGSSPTFDGLDWNRISESIGTGIENWGTAGSSPSEWELMQQRSPNATRTFIGVSPIDLNENCLCDFRAEIVPLVQTIRDLRSCRAEWSFCTRVLNQYPLMYLRKLFPTAGRSDGVMVGIRAKLLRLAGRSSGASAGEAPQFGGTDRPELLEKVSDWSAARVDRHFVLTRAACSGKQSFDGVKKQALLRMLHRAREQGQVTLIVLPMSPIYEKEFLTRGVIRKFEQALADIQDGFPGLQIVRLDRLAALHNNDRFYDFFHLNTSGQQIATPAFLDALQAF